MPPKIDKNLCNGCPGRAESCCEEICPGDLMTRGADGKGHCREDRDCWDCMSCVKACPRNAIETVLPYQIGYYGAAMKAVATRDRIIWKCRDINGSETKYSFRTRNDPDE